MFSESCICTHHVVVIVEERGKWGCGNNMGWDLGDRQLKDQVTEKSMSVMSKTSKQMFRE